MKKIFTILSILITAAILSACSRESEMRTIKEIRYLKSSGSILPELQWVEEYLLSAENATLSRKGRIENSQVNAGSWNLIPDRLVLKELFDALQKMGCAKLNRIDPADPPDGGGSEEFTIVYETGDTCIMRYDPGVTYENGDEYAALIRSFISTIDLPGNAVNRHLIP